MILPSWFNLYGRAFTSMVGFLFTTEIIWYTYTKFRCFYKRNQHIIDESKPITEVFFFSENSAACRLHLNYNSPCQKENCPIISLK
jgi:hypothetical protein